MMPMVELTTSSSSPSRGGFVAARPRRLAIGLVALFAYTCVAPGSLFNRGRGVRPHYTDMGNGSRADHERGRAAAPGASSGGTSWHPPNLCQRDHIVEGRWEPVHLDEPPYRPPFLNPKCASRNKKKYREENGWDTYEWVPNAAAGAATSKSGGETCEFTAWNKDAFCELARFGTILIVGDSLSWEHYASLAQLLGVPMYEGFQHISRTAKTNVGHAVCGGRTRLVYRRDDALTQIREALREIEPNLPQVLVLNRGAHYANDTTYLTELRAALDVVEEWLGRCDQLHIKCHFFWRTTVPGHVNCQTFAVPVHDKAVIEAYIANRSLYDRKTLNFHWYDFQHQNLLAEDELKRRAPSLPYRILDGYHINVLRPDEHYDCLHSCYPGKMDVYGRLMLHYLRIDRSQEDVKRLENVFNEQRWTVNVSTVYYDWRKGPPNGSAATAT